MLKLCLIFLRRRVLFLLDLGAKLAVGLTKLIEAWLTSSGSVTPDDKADVAIQQMMTLAAGLEDLSKSVVELSELVQQNREALNNLANVQFEMAYEYALFINNIQGMVVTSSIAPSRSKRSKGLALPYFQNPDDDDDMLN